jgi:hypothetical protein
VGLTDFLLAPAKSGVYYWLPRRFTMARRASSKLHPGILIGAAAAIVVAIVAGKSVLGKKTAGFTDVPKLRVEEFLENGNSLRGNEYVVEGEIDEKFFRSSSRGQVVSLRVGNAGENELVPIEIPPEFTNMNIERQQRYAFKVRFRDGGIPVATGINRL